MERPADVCVLRTFPDSPLRVNHVGMQSQEPCEEEPGDNTALDFSRRLRFELFVLSVANLRRRYELSGFRASRRCGCFGET